MTLAALGLGAFFAGPASAGQIVITGHDADDHCSGQPAEQCHYFRVATNFARQGAPNPGRPLLLLDCNGGVRRALDNAFGAGNIARDRVCPSDAPQAFRNLELSTQNFSAILVGSSCDDADTEGIGDNTLNLTDDQKGGCDDPGGSTPDSDLINERTADIRRFFNRGGGLFVMSGDNNGDGDPTNGPDVYYDFLPLPAEGVAVNPPFCLTERGIQLGFEDQSCPDPSFHNGTRDDINCCETHNSFAEPPAESALKVAERDSQGFAETLVGRGTIGGGGFASSCFGQRPDIIASPKGGELVGTPGPDVIVGRRGPDEIRGLGGNDVICGRSDDDILLGGPGNDRMRGNNGQGALRGGGGGDLLNGGPRADNLFGGFGDDVLRGRAGPDDLFGQAGADTLNGGTGTDVCDGGAGSDNPRDNCESTPNAP